MGYSSTFINELILSLKNGILLETVKIEGKSPTSKDEFTILRGYNFVLFIPADFTDSTRRVVSFVKDTIMRYNKNHIKYFSTIYHCNNRRLLRSERKPLLEERVDSLITQLSDSYTFSEKKTEHIRGGTVCWADGESKTQKEYIRVFIMSNYSSQLIVEYKEKIVKLEDFVNMVDYMIWNLRLMECDDINEEF